MYTKAEEIGWDNPVQQRRQKRDLPTERLGQNHGAVKDYDDMVSQFWQVWQESQDQLYRCCLKMMNSNRADAEDALSRAMLKAWEKVQKFRGKIRNLKAWLYRLTRNFCLDIIKEHSRGAAGVESIEWVGNTEEMSTAARVECPESVLEREERSEQIRGAIAELPENFQETFILHFYRELSYKEIAEQQGISYQNVCKRISLARKQLKEKLSGYFRGTDEDVGQKNRRAVETTATQTKPACAGLKNSDLTLVPVPVSVPHRVEALGLCSSERPSPPTEESGERQRNMEIKTVSAEQESFEEVEAETSELVDGSVKSKELASQTIQETATVSAQKCVELVLAIPEFVESFVEPRELVRQTINEVGNPSGKLPLLSRLVAVRGGEPPVFLPSSILDNTKSGLTTLLTGVLKVFPILKNLSQWGFMGRNWDRTLGDTGGEAISPLNFHLAGFSQGCCQCLSNI